MSTNQDQSSYQKSRIPRFLQVQSRDRALSVGPVSELDRRIAQGEAELTAKDVAKVRPSPRTRAVRKLLKAVAEVEENIQFFNQKALQREKIEIPGGHEG